MTPLAALVLRALEPLCRLPACDLEAESARLATMAHAVATAAQDAPAPFSGPAATEARALALVAIASRESALAADVADCRRRGDLGINPVGALGPWQLLGPQSRGGHSPAEVCASVELGATLALRVLAMHGARCPRGGPLAAFQGYGGGACGRPAWVRAGGRRFDAGLEQCLLWERLCREAGLRGASCWRTSEIVKG